MPPETLLVWTAAAVAAAALVTVLVISRTNRPRRPRAGIPTIDLGPESPATVNLLTNGFNPGREAMAATVLDLAVRRWVEVDWIGGQTLLRPRSRGKGELAAHDRLVMDHLGRLARNGVVPGHALTTGGASRSNRWWRRFAKAVIRDARDRGLCRPRWGKGIVSLTTAATVVSLVILTFVVPALRESDTSNPSPASAWELVVAGVLTGLLVLVLSRLSASLQQRDTDADLAAAGRWLGVRAFLAEDPELADKPAAAVLLLDDFFAHAAALGLARRALRDLPFGSEDDRRAWSDVTGTWRQVRVRYPSFRPGWGRHPWLAVGFALLKAAPAVVLLWVLAKVAGGDVFDDAAAVDLAALGIGALAVAFLGWQAWVVILGLADATASREVEGVLLRRRVFHESPWAQRIWSLVGFRSDEVPTEGENSDSTPRYWLAVDDGSAAEVTAWSVRPEVYHGTWQGLRVRVTVTPRLGYVRGIVPLELPPDDDLDDEGDLADEAAAEPVRDGAVVPGFMLRLVEKRLAKMPEAEREAALDKVEASGVSIRERLARLQRDDGEG
jgi:hypothetical protein